MRILLDYVLPLAFPTILFIAWHWIARHRAKARGETELPRLRDGPWLWLLAGGLALLGAALLTLALTTGEPAGGRYEPPALIDGAVRPGRVLR